MTRPSARSAVSRPLRQVLVAVHIICSVGWLGAGAANVVLAVVAVTTTDGVVRHVAYRMIERLDTYLVIPLAFTALASGVVVAVCTPWGLTRYRWVLVKLVLTVVVIVFSTFAIGVWVEQSIGATGTGGASPVAWPLVGGAASNLVAFVFMTWVSTAKPWGRLRR